MKLILAIVNSQDEKEITAELMRGGFSVTKISSTGGIIRGGLTTLVCVCSAERVAKALDILKSTAKASKYEMSNVNADLKDYTGGAREPAEIVVGGATVFVLNVEESYKF